MPKEELQGQLNGSHSFFSRKERCCVFRNCVEIWKLRLIKCR